MEKIIELRTCVENISKDAHKFFQKNNKAAGVRARKKLQRCKKLSQEIRNDIQKTKQENDQEKSAELSALAAVNGGNSLIEERFFLEKSFLLPCQNFGNISSEKKELTFSLRFPIYPGESTDNLFWEKENFTKIVPNKMNIPFEIDFYTSFGE